MQPKIEKHDLETKSKFISEFLGEGNKVKVSIRFRGRELAHTELGKVVLDRILAKLTDLGVGYNVDRGAVWKEEMMSMIVSPPEKTPTQARRKKTKKQYIPYGMVNMLLKGTCSL